MNQLPEPYEYGQGYIILKVHKFRDLPETIHIDGEELLLKSEFHVSLVCTKRIAGIIDKTQKEKIESELVEQFSLFVKDKDLASFKPTKNFRLVKRGEREVLVMMVELPGLKELFDSLSKRYAKNIPIQPAHITMYTLQPNASIGILSYRELESDSRPVEVEGLSDKQFIVESV